MALPIEFPQANIKLGAPQGWTDEECGGLPAWRGTYEIAPDEDQPSEGPGRTVSAIVSCWKLNAEDLAEIQRSGVVWLTVTGTGMPPVSISTENPFDAPQPDLG